MSRRARKEETRTRVEAAARALFEERGFEATTIRAIARAAGVATGTVMLHCASKLDLLVGLLEEELGEVVADRTATLPAEAPLVDQLVHLLGGFLQRYAEHPELSRVYLKEVLFLPPGQGAGYDALTLQFLEQLGSLVRAHAHALRPGVQAEVVAYQVFALYVLAITTLLRQPEPDADAAARSLHATIQATLAPLWR